MNQSATPPTLAKRPGVMHGLHNPGQVIGEAHASSNTCHPVICILLYQRIPKEDLNRPRNLGAMHCMPAFRGIMHMTWTIF